MHTTKKDNLNYKKFGKLKSPKPLVFIAGPCVIESKEMCFKIASKLSSLKKKHGWTVFFKASFDKANRTSINAYRGPGMEKGLEILYEVGKKYNLPLVTDIHLPEQADPVSKVVDIIQIPAFLCRQTDLLKAAAKTKIPVNIKKGQFLSPWDMEQSIGKVKGFGNNKVMVTERGASFGYNNLVSDMRSLQIMRKNNVPVIFDATHSVQLPGGQGKSSGGQPEFIRTLVNAATASVIDGLFMEVHPTPKKALSDASSSLELKKLEEILLTATKIDRIVKK